MVVPIPEIGKGHGIDVVEIDDTVRRTVYHCNGKNKGADVIGCARRWDAADDLSI
jgi:hypothetical protein